LLALVGGVEETMKLGGRGVRMELKVAERSDPRRQEEL
jgi:hypothetical protein